MHGQEETSQIPRLITELIHLVIVFAVAWIYFGAGTRIIFGWFGSEVVSPGDISRRIILFGFSVVFFARMTATLFYILKRKFGWEELGGVVFAIALYQIGFALFGITASEPLGVIDLTAVVLFLFGSYLNTGSELQRKRFKADPANSGKLYTRGLFRLSQHINYFGDTLWALGWALMTRNAWALLVPLCLALAFIFAFIPPLSKYLKQRYGAQYDEWSRTTKKFIPYIY